MRLKARVWLPLAWLCCAVVAGCASGARDQAQPLTLNENMPADPSMQEMQGPKFRDGVLSEGELCDCTADGINCDLRGETCASVSQMPMSVGALLCDPVTCTFDLSMCMQPQTPVPTAGTGS